MAVDQGTPQQMSFVNLTVVVTDANDNPPVCAQKHTKAGTNVDPEIISLGSNPGRFSKHNSNRLCFGYRC